MTAIIADRSGITIRKIICRIFRFDTIDALLMDECAHFAFEF